MRKFIMCTAALALMSSAAVAQQGNGKGNGNGKSDVGVSAKTAGAAAGAKANGVKLDKGKPDRKQRAFGPDRKTQRDAAVTLDRKLDRALDRTATASGGGKYNRNNKDRPFIVDRNGNGALRDVGRRGTDMVSAVAALPSARSRGLIDGCPPGLAKKTPSCIPPGLTRNDLDRDGDARARMFRPDFFGLGMGGDNRYFMNNGYLMNLGAGNRITGYLPLLAGALATGNPWPENYQSRQVPDYYASYYNLGSQDDYRFADNVLYRVDRDTSTIQSIAALLTGDRFTVGQPMPSGYDVYNVPYEYRSRYSDTPDTRYRYSDGYVYQVDPKTQLITSAIELLVS
ncbi:hypothetical protein HME9302_00510 [Alteripontixanthobacter maritimus]|uniref:Uncharacterized protein n=1 Tax=Alteripontixanthobacter maritimus TaxID=2161824 RepID=A0A369Q350_9SPHN|nr:hypothetical protein [Alteripontixanthobacter maritimus]RDC59323.1 hypothetical protein HME9302_00510 [Alteripontixanthobacter maritimus]